MPCGNPLRFCKISRKVVKLLQFRTEGSQLGGQTGVILVKYSVCTAELDSLAALFANLMAFCCMGPLADEGGEGPPVLFGRQSLRF